MYKRQLADWAKTVGQPQQAENKGVDMSKLSPEERAKLEAEIKEDQALSLIHISNRN